MVMRKVCVRCQRIPRVVIREWSELKILELVIGKGKKTGMEVLEESS